MKLYHKQGLMMRKLMIFLWLVVDITLIIMMLFVPLSSTTKTIIILVMVVATIYAIIDYIIYQKNYLQAMIQAKKEKIEEKHD